MRRVVYSHMVSLDGYIEADEAYTGPSWAVSDEELSRHFVELERGVDLHLYGRRIYEHLAAWWPMADQNPALPAYLAEYGRLWKAKPKVVFSSQLQQTAWNARLVKDSAAAEVAGLKAQPGGELALYGSGLAASLIPLGLVDEYRFYVNPAVLGRGRPMFPALDHVLHLQLIETRVFGCGAVLLRYTPRTEALGPAA